MKIGRPRKSSASILLLWLLISGFTLYQYIQLEQSRRTIEHKTGEHALTLVRLVAEHAASRIDAADAALQDVATRLGAQDLEQGLTLPAPRRQALESLLKSRQARTPGVVSMSITDAEGRVFANALDQPQGTFLGNRSYFLDLKADRSRSPAISEVVQGRVSQQWGIQVARRLELPAGGFGGMLVANLGVRENFEDFYNSLGLNKQDLVTLRDPGNRILVRYPVRENTLGKVVSGSAALDQILSGQQESLARSTSPVDHVERMVASRRLSGHPVYAVVGIGLDDALEPWRQQRTLTLLMGIGGVAAGLLLSLGIQSRERSMRELALVDYALNRVGEAAFIADESGRFRFVNDESCKSLGMSRGKLLRSQVLDISTETHTPAQWKARWELVKTHRALRFESQHRRADGSTFPVEIHVNHFEFDGAPYLLALARDISERRKAETEIRHLAFHDPLTGLPNRRLLLDRLLHALEISQRQRRPGALMLLDLDDFKTLNDTQGHDAGDRLLIEVAQRLHEAVRDSDTVARLGGDEFAVILESLDEQGSAAAQAEAVARHILQHIDRSVPPTPTGQAATPGPASHACSASIGIVLFEGNQPSVDDLMKRADTALYQVKAAGGRGLRFFDPQMQAEVQARAMLHTDLREALRCGQFELHYQAVVDRQGRRLGAEALLRWQHPVRGWVSPAEFIPFAERSGLILPLGHWVFETACRQLQAWSDRPGLAGLGLSINVSARQFREADFVERLVAVLQSTGADPARLTLELTESLLLEDTQGVIGKLKALKALGLSLALDDFGTGYSSLSYLKQLPLDTLKIDRSFVADLLVSPNDAAIACTVIALGHALGLKVVAEGVEQQAQQDYLMGQGCDAFQGYLHGRPMPPGPFEEQGLLCVGPDAKGPGDTPGPR
ncbi:MAG: EAL domain-containing protein [Curvibacter sp.]|nr:EAL domain-containing protein [Curvibacter sp.]